MADYLANAFPEFAARVARLELANLPTPVDERVLSLDGRRRRIAVKHDNLTHAMYGGNKVRKLEYLLRRAIDHDARRVATFGSVASHHALATALFARKLGLGCTCLLSHQTRTAKCETMLRLLLDNDCEIECLGKDRVQRVATMRRALQGRASSVIPMGGTSWLGTVGYVNAALELADQVERGEIEAPNRIYVATGTLGTAVGISLGIALADMETEVHAVRVAHPLIVNSPALDRLLNKTALVMHRYDASIPADLAARARIRLRDEFLGPGYARTTPESERAVALARRELDIELETTYTGKAMAALLSDLSQIDPGFCLFWNTYNSQPLPETGRETPDSNRLPAEFLHYFPAASS